MNVAVILLDGGQFEVENLQKNTMGKHVFKNACNTIGLTEEVDYFGLRFVNKKDGEFQWVDNERTLKSQLGKTRNENITHYLYFAVKFFPVNATNIKHDLTRYQFVLQLRESLLNGRLECSAPIYALLGSFIAQAEFGDSEDLSANYLDDFKVVNEQSPEITEKIRDYHRRHKGMTPAQAELNFLDNVRKLPLYGVHRHLALDVNCEKVFIGVSNIGVTVYRASRLMSTFIWPKILNIGFKSKNFYIKIKPADEDDDFYKTTVGFKLSDRVAAKRLWKVCVEHHTFFRLENVDLAEKKGWLSRFGSPFRYQGKTEHEIMKEEPKPEEPFSRVSSKRFSERVLKGNRKQPQETKAETDGKETSKQESPKVEQETPQSAIKIDEAAVASTVDIVESSPKKSTIAALPEIKVVQPSPELRVKSSGEHGGKKEETVNDSTEEKVEETKDDTEKDEDEEKKDRKGSTDGEDAVATTEDQLVISNPLALGEVKSYASQSITTTTHTSHSSSDNPEETVQTSSTVISSTQVISTQQTTTQQVATTKTVKETIVETSQCDSSSSSSSSSSSGDGGST